MKHYIKQPEFPENKVIDCLVGSRYNEVVNDLKQLGVCPIKISGSELLDIEIRDHSDINAFYKGNGQLLLSKHIKGESVPFPEGLIIDYSCNIIKSPYPEDVKLNALILGKRLICNPKTISPKILAFADNNGFEIVSVKQGYSKCAICVVNENAVITEDPGIASLLKKCQIEVLTVKPNNIYLSDAHFGFLGGASGKLDKNLLYFNGNLEEHESYNEIIHFLDNHKIKPFYKTNRKLTDFGGLIPLTELNS